jgi:hypothetical protein
MSVQPAEVRAKTYSGATRVRVYACYDQKDNDVFSNRFLQPMNDDDSVGYPILSYSPMSLSPDTKTQFVGETGFWAMDSGDAINWFSAYTGALIVGWQYDTPDRLHLVSSRVANAATPSS